MRCDAEVIEDLQSIERGMALPGAVCYFKITNNQEFVCKKELLELKDALKLLQNLDGVNSFNRSESIWLFSDEVEPKRDHSLHQRNGFG